MVTLFYPSPTPLLSNLRAIHQELEALRASLQAQAAEAVVSRQQQAHLSQQLEQSRAQALAVDARLLRVTLKLQKRKVVAYGC